jgi:uncharacterized protein with von Willebrand factor type A (vWA) domain
MNKQQLIRENYIKKPNPQILKYLENIKKADEDHEAKKNASHRIVTKPKSKPEPEVKPEELEELEQQLVEALLFEDEEENKKQRRDKARQKYKQLKEDDPELLKKRTRNKYLKNKEKLTKK